MIPTYNLENLTGNLDEMFQKLMQLTFFSVLILLVIWIIVSLLIWLFRSQEKV